MKKKIYRSPCEDSKFKAYWKKFIPKIVDRENFHESHLEQLVILIRLYLEYNELTRIINLEGMTYENTGRYGHSIKPHPAVQLRQKTISEIRAYSKALDLVLTKDAGPEEPEEEDGF